VGIGTHEEDQVSVTTGFRRIEASAESGLKINGERVPIRGVALHHDRAAIGSALRTRHYDEDLEQIRDIGANAIRSTTAPHAQYLYDRCDEMGMLAWIDMPFTRAPYLSDVFYYATNSFRDNGLQQLREIILQNYNHPSIVMWGIYSLIWQRGDNVLDYVRELNSTAKALDPSRATVACSNQDGDINFITDLIVWQQSLGWERGVIDDVKVWSDKLHTEWSHLCSAVAYGEGGSIDQQTDLPLKSGEIDKRWLPEQWHTSLHEGYAKILNTDEKFWGIWINNMYEFGSVRHNDGISRTGLITFDHKDKKDAYYLYRALWNKEQPTLHIAEKRRNVRQDSMQVVKVYSSAAEAPTLLVNKEAVTLNEVAPCIYESDAVPMTPRTQVVVKAGEMEDHTTITIGNALVQSR
jgi:beta-galactosidase